MIIVEYAAFKKTDHTVWSAMTFGTKFHHAPSKSWAKSHQRKPKTDFRKGAGYDQSGEIDAI